MQIYNNNKGTHTLKKGTYNKIDLLVKVTAPLSGSPTPPVRSVSGSTADTYAFPIAKPFNPSAVNVTVNFRHNKRPFPIFTGSLREGSAAETIGDSRFLQSQGYNPMVIDYSTENQTITALIPYTIAFPDYVNLRGDDELVIKVNVGNDAFDSDLVATESYVRVEWPEAVGVGVRIPEIEIHALGGENISDKFDLGDNVTKIVLLNFDKETSYEKDSLIRDYVISSDKLNETYDFDQMVMERNQMFENEKEADLRMQSFVLYDDPSMPLHDTDINMGVYQKRLTVGENFLVVYKSVNHPDILDRAANLVEKHEGRDDAQLKRFSV